jgi:APA family basic amino acid/polyamine antiporter
VALGIIVLLFGVNILGIRQSSTINIVFTIIEAGGLIFIIVIAAPHIGDVNLLELPAGGGHAVIAAAALAFFAFVGFEEIVKLSEETKNPEKNIPRALFVASIIVIIMYTLVAIAAVSIIPYEQLGMSESPLADIASKSFGKTGVIIISVIALFATSNTILSNMIGSSRVLLSMSSESKILKPLAIVSSKRKTPVMALIVVLVVTAAFALIGDIETIARISTLFIFTAFILINLSVVVLRIRDKNLKRPYRIPLNIKNIPITSVLGIILTSALLGYAIVGFF